VAGILTGNKQITRLLLQRAGVLVPEGRRFHGKAIESGIAYAKALGFPVVLKPLVGTGGIGVVAGIRSEEDLRWAFEALSRSLHKGEPFIIEKHISGRLPHIRHPGQSPLRDDPAAGVRRRERGHDGRRTHLAEERYPKAQPSLDG
jgi:D-alanine-D-alanine ligase-like ATP-grasp enzyme